MFKPLIESPDARPTVAQSASIGSESVWKTNRVAIFGLAALFAAAIVSWLIQSSRGEAQSASPSSDAGNVRTLAPVPNVTGEAGKPVTFATEAKVNHAECEPVIARFEDRLRQLEREQCENLGTFQIAGRSTLFLLFRRMSEDDRRQLIASEVASITNLSAADRQYVGENIERLARDYLAYPSELRILSVTGPGKRDEPMELSMWDIENESNLGRTDSGLPTWKSGPTGGWTSVLNDGLKSRYGHLFALEDENG